MHVLPIAPWMVFRSYLFSVDGSCVGATGRLNLIPFCAILQILGFDTSMESLLAVGGRSGSFADLNNTDFGLSSKSFSGRDLLSGPGKDPIKAIR